MTEAEYRAWIAASGATHPPPPTFSRQPLITLTLPSPDGSAAVAPLIHDLRQQDYPHWRLYLHAAHPQLADGVETGRDSRVSWTTAPRATIEGEYLATLSPQTRLVPWALSSLLQALQEQPADLIYADEDRLDAEGRPHSPWLKPAWSPDLQRSHCYLGDFVLYRSQLFPAGALPPVGPDWPRQVALLAATRAERILHLPRILSHRTGPPPVCRPQARALPVQNDAPVRTSIIIPTRDRLDLLRDCLGSIEQFSTGARDEIIIVDNGSKEEETLNFLQHTPHRVLRIDAPFNYAALNNRAAEVARGEYLLFLNSDIRALHAGWLEAMLVQAARPEVGAVGAQLLFPDGTIQHAGVVLGIGVAGHAHKHLKPAATYHQLAQYVRNYSAVTGACLMIRRDRYQAMGGMNELALPISFNDVDLCLRLRQEGYLVVYTPQARLEHRESATRVGGVTPAETAYMRERWGDLLAADPYYHPTLSRQVEDFRLDLTAPEGTRLIHAAKGGTQAIPLGRADIRLPLPASRLCGIGLKFATYLRQCHGTLTATLELGQHRLRYELDTSTLADNTFHDLRFPPLDLTPPGEARVTLGFRGATREDRLALWRDEQGEPMYRLLAPLEARLMVRAAPGTDRWLAVPAGTEGQSD